jgi:hypothetical protein
MRLRSVALTLVVGALVAAPALAQRGGGGGGGRGGMQRGGDGGPASILALLQNKSVQKELNIDDADVGKVPDAVLKALESVLKPEQVKRLKEISLQQRGARALADPKIQTALKITDDQKEKIKTIQEDARKEIAALNPRGNGGAGGGGRGNRGGGEARQKLNAETMKKLVEVLSPDQRKTWTAMVGEPFELKREQPMGRGGRNRNNNNN